MCICVGLVIFLNDSSTTEFSTYCLTLSRHHALPIFVLLMPRAFLVAGASIASHAFLALLGGIGARAGGARLGRATLRVTFWGALAMVLTAGIGALFGTVV